MNAYRPNPSPAEDGELEDGEICDDETEESVPMRRGEGNRPRGGAGQRTRKPHHHPQNAGPLLGHQPPGFMHVLPYNHGPFSPSHRQQCGPSGPDRPPFPPAALGLPLPPPPGLGLLGEPSPRSNFWERSHDALGRFRHRVLPNRGRGGRNRGGMEGNFRVPPGRYGPPEIHGSPLRKQKPPPRNRPRKDGSGIPGVSRVEAGTNESFEDLLSKYKQIQLELECIRKEETMVLGPSTSPLREGAADSVAGPPEATPAPGLGPGPVGAEELAEREKKEKKVFHAFNIKPLRQKLPVPAILDQSQTECVDPDAAGGAAAGSLEETVEGGAAVAGEKKPCVCCSKDTPLPAGGASAAAGSLEQTVEGGAAVAGEKKPCVCCSKDTPLPAGGASAEKSASEAGVKEWCVCCSEEAQAVSSCPSQSPASSEESSILPDKVEKVEEEELSELQLRLLALQSASKKWQQKEQQVMKKTKDRISKAAQDKNSSSELTSPTKQRVTTRSASAAAAAAAATDRNSRSRSKLAEKDRTKTRPRPADRERPKQSPKLGSKAAPARSRTPARPHSSKKMTSLGSAVKQTVRKQQLHTWKQQQQKKLEDKRRQEEEDRRKREEEIRRIRDLSNQDEQYNRFMRLVGGRRTRSGSRDQDHRKSAGKPGMDTLGNLYQYDNYDEVAMDTDSETGSPASSPKHDLLSAHEAGCFPPPDVPLHRAEAAVFGMPFLSSTLQSVPPPPPPLPPPDELEPPPKPPFADEEEEEEMLLRETCLMSMANKRVAAEKSSSAPPSPSCPPPSDVQPPARGNLSVVSLNTVPAGRGGRFSRTHHASRAPLVLPRHKSVVVSLNDSDDSDSDVDGCSSSQAEFGGLEFMIKEARRTVEAAKPKAASGCEKENNPVRSAEAPEAQKANSLLHSEQLSRDRLKKDQTGSPAPEPALDQILWPAAELQLSKVEHRLSKHRELLQRDEVILRHLLQQELKKTESLKMAEAKVAKLREQLHASERIVVANRTLLKKLQEQVQRVEQRVSVKKTQAVQLEKELIQAQVAAGQGAKRPAESIPPMPSKLQRVDAPRHCSEHQFAELIAQKRRLQQLEAEYALKIQKLKEAQALRNKTGPAEPQAPASIPPPDPPVERLPAPTSFHPPQPSLHDLSQDKLTLDSEDVLDADDQEPEPPAAPISKDGRRSSFRQSNSSFTKPHLDAVNSTSSKDGSSTKLAKTGGGGELPAEMFAGLNMESLRQRFQQQTQLGELLHREMHMLGGNVNDPPAQQFPMQVLLQEGETSQLAGLELKPVPFKAYHSPLLTFRSYRFSPYYRTKEKLSLSSVSFSNAIQANKCFCRFDLMGTCNHDGCRWQHMRNCTMSRDQLYQDILSYNLSLIGCSESSSDQEIGDATESYLKKLFGPNKDRMSVDQMAVLLVSKVNESKKHVPPFTTCKDARKWRPKPSLQTGGDGEDSGDEAPEAQPTPAGDGACRSGAPPVDACVTSEDRRYFISETDDIANLEASVLESPRDTQLWIKLAFRYLNQTDTSAAEGLEAALNTLSRALESNCDDPEVWSHYLLLFSRRGSQEEVQEMCEMAVEHAPDYRVWWNYLNLESSFEGRDYVCERLLQFLLVESSCDARERRSFQLMEALLYRVQLSLFTGRMESALAILQNALKSSQERSVADHMTPADRALLWLSYIHLTEFDQLPASLFDPAESGPGRVVSKESFLLPWRTQQDVSTPPDILIALFQDAVHRCSEESASDGERTLACLPLHSNLILLYKLLQKYEQGVSLCESLLEMCPDSSTLRSALADLHLSRGDAESATGTWLHALAECPHDAQVFYHCCCFLMNQEKSGAVPPLLRAFILSLCEDDSSRMSPVDILRHLLGFSTKELPIGAVIKKELQGHLRQQMPMLHLLHCRWQWLQGGVEEVVEAFERALGSPLQLSELHLLWMDYLLFSCSPQAGADAARLFPDLVNRCLSTIPSRLELPFNPAVFWSSYGFHNKVVALYLRHIPQPQRALVLERLREAMPNNIELGLRLLLQEWQNGNLEQVKFQARILSNCAPRCLSSWRIAIAVEKELRERAERLLYEAAEGGASQRLQRLVDRCRQTGVSVSLGGVGPLLADDV
uniref:Zinc finger C3H1-type containing n=1 Tax=Oryzias melastigma TaxID=30732 RepID=A0A3B3DNC9_ORYME